MSLIPTSMSTAARDLIYEETRLTIPEDFSQESWESLGRTLQQMERSVLWWVGDWWNFGERKYGQMSSQAAKDLVEDQIGYVYGTVSNAGYVANRFEFSRRRENLPWSFHQDVASLEPEIADQWLSVAAAEGWDKRELRAALREARQAALHERLVAAPAPNGTFNVIYADPPWEYEFVETDNRAIENHYPTMTLSDICALTVDDRAISEIATGDAILFLWTTPPKAEEAMRVIHAWGFEYRTQLVWVKDRIGMGYYARQRHELLYVCRRGVFPVPLVADRPDSVIEHPKGRHSAKPDEVYDLIERMYPQATRLELFARRERPGWVQWGNEPGVTFGAA